jgi:hypothetical protein
MQTLISPHKLLILTCKGGFLIAGLAHGTHSQPSIGFTEMER